MVSMTPPALPITEHVRSALLLQRESAIFLIKAVEMQLDLETCLSTKAERRMLRFLRENPAVWRQVEQMMSGGKADGFGAGNPNL